MEYLHWIEIAVSVVTGGLLWQVWNLRAALEKTAAAANAAKQNAWDNQLLIKDLARDHLDIKELLKSLERDGTTFKDAISDLQKEHGSHNETQAKMLLLLELIERKQHEKRH